MRIYLLSIALWWAFAPALAGNRTIVAAADAYPPYIDAARPTGGLTAEIVRAAYQTQGYEVQLEVLPWARAELGVTEGRYDVLLNVWRTEARARTLMFSAPYATGKIKFIKRKGDPFEYKGLDSLQGKRIGVVRGYGYGDAFNNSPQFVREEVSELAINLKKLTLKRIDLTLEDEITARSVLQREDPEVAGLVVFTQNALSDNPLYIAAGWRHPNHREMIDAFNKGLEAIKANGTLASIHKRYGLDR